MKKNLLFACNVLVFSFLLYSCAPTIEQYANCYDKLLSITKSLCQMADEARDGVSHAYSESDLSKVKESMSTDLRWNKIDSELADVKKLLTKTCSDELAALRGSLFHMETKIILLRKNVRCVKADWREYAVSVREALYEFNEEAEKCKDKHTYIADCYEYLFTELREIESHFFVPNPNPPKYMFLGHWACNVTRPSNEIELLIFQPWEFNSDVYMVNRFFEEDAIEGKSINNKQSNDAIFRDGKIIVCSGEYSLGEYYIDVSGDFLVPEINGSPSKDVRYYKFDSDKFISGDNKVRLGMTYSQVINTRGYPDKEHKTNGIVQYMYYGDTQICFDDGVVYQINETN